MKKARSFFCTSAPVRRISVVAKVSVRLGEPLSIVLRDQDGFTAKAATKFLAEFAVKRPLNKEIVEKQLRRIGTTIFALDEITLDLEPHLMIPISEINAARRKAFAQLQEKRMAHYQRPTLPAFFYKEPPTRVQQKERARIVALTDTISGLREALAAGADEIVFGGDSYHHQTISLRDYKEALQLARHRGAFIVFNTPRILLRRDMLAWRRLLEGFARLFPDGVNLHNIGTFPIVRDLGLQIHVDASIPIVNHLTLKELKTLGARRGVLSPELTLDEAAILAARAPFPVECIVEGNLELMVSKYCPLGSFLENAASSCSMPCRKKNKRYALLDRKGMFFPLVFDASCHMHVLNSKRLSMLLHAMKFAPRGITFLRIDGRFMEAAALGRCVSLYKEWSDFSGTLLKEQEEYLKKLEGADTTRGHYFRGVQ